MAKATVDEEEGRWMSVFEHSRTPTPSTQIGRTTQEVTLTTMKHVGNSSNETPPLPPLHEGHAKAVADRRRAREATESDPDLTALPRRSGPIHHTFAQRAFLAAKSDLLYNYVRRHRRPWDFRTTNHGALDLTTLQQTQKYVLQQKLVAQVKAMGAHGCWMEIGIGETLREYCQVIRDLEYMKQHADGGRHDHAFLITTARPLEAQLLEEAGLAQQSPGSISVRRDISAHIRHLRRGSPCLRLLVRLFILLAISTALLVPYFAVVFTTGYIPQLIVNCACIAIFAICMAVLTWDSSLLAAIALTMIYAAGIVIYARLVPARGGWS